MANIKIAILNEFKGLSNSQVKKAVLALQKQVSHHFAPVWGINADLTFYPDGKAPASSWQLVILDTSDQANALGYHDLTATGLPMGKIFAGTDLRTGTSWTVTASHELLEMLGDPEINLNVLTTDKIGDNTGAGILYSYENCDACESDQYGYLIDGTRVSDFLFPTWFETFHPKGTQYDYCKYISDPFQLLPGGYSLVSPVSTSVGWQQIYPAQTELKYSMRAHIGSRRERRAIPRTQWLKSAKKIASPTHAAAEDVPEQVTISFAVNFFNGEGEIQFFGEGIPDDLTITSDMPASARTFTARQTSGDKFITVTGTAPESDGGKITVEVMGNGKILSPAAQNTYEKGVFDKIIIYTV